MKKLYHSVQQAMDHAKDYSEWRAAATEHDRLSGMQEWKEDDASPYYDYPMIRYRLNELKEARHRQDVNQLVFHLHEGLHGNLGNISNPILYRTAKFGTKKLITDYLEEVCRCLEFVSEYDFPDFPFVRKLEFFESTGQAFGRSALMLSGGAALGLFHLGVIKAIWGERLLPTVMSGSSIGSIIVATIGTHTDEELDKILQPDYLHTQAFKLVGWRGFFRGRPLLDGDHLEECLNQNVPDLTFEEAFKRTGRSINITVSPYDTHQESRLLNARTSPNVVLRKAALASCAIPGVFPPVTLWAKNGRGDKVPYNAGRKWVDGSIKNDLPFQRLARLYGVNHTIVSQTNPHVLPFLSRKARSGVLGFARQWAAKNFNLNTYMMLDFFRKNVPNNELALLIDKAQSVVSQRYEGDINILPPNMPMNLLKLTKNIDQHELNQFIEFGEKSAWPSIEMIRNTTCIGRTFDSCIKKLRDEEVKRIKNPRLALVG
ncbi:MAG: DUF3336 domain-containing protein [Pseudomonadota bacterium]